MSLSALVTFAQRYFGSLAEDTRAGDAVAHTQAGDGEALSAELVPPRPGLPMWLRQRAPEQELPDGSEHSWKTEGPIVPQRPSPDVNTLGADALAFYAPFHFYRKGWGIFVRMSGVVHLGTVLKGGTIQPGDEPILDLAEFILGTHEWHHASTEIACTRAELTARRSLYHPYFA